jgi:hypothetical protein
MRRDLRLDSIRGFLLAEITFVHAHAPGSFMVNEFFGRVSMAAGFVFLSGLVAGAVYGKIADGSMTDCTSAAVRRGFYIHKYHVATFVFLLLTALLLPNYIEHFEFEWIRDSSEAWRNVLKFMFLGYQPRYFDILPLYALFVLAMPLAFYAFRKGHSSAFLAVSVGIWALAQLGLGDERAFGGSDFNPFAWQLLYFSGLYFGYFQIQRQRNIVRPHTGLIAMCLAVAALGFSLRWNLLPWPDAVQKGTFLSNKTNHSILYVVNFYAFVYLVCCISQRFPLLVTIRPFVYLGKHSIQVFSFHILVVYLSMPLMSSIRHEMPGVAFALGLSIVASLFIPAMIHNQYRKRSHREARSASGAHLAKVKTAPDGGR